MNERGAVRFSWHMLERVREYGLAGYVSNAEIATALCAHFDDRITEANVANWRRQYPKFDSVCRRACDEPNVVAANVLFTAIKDGDLATARWWSERRNPAFMPKSKSTLDMPSGTLDDVLKRRTVAEQEADARARGLLSDAPVDEDDEEDEE